MDSPAARAHEECRLLLAQRPDGLPAKADESPEQH